MRERHPFGKSIDKSVKLNALTDGNENGQVGITGNAEEESAVANELDCISFCLCDRNGDGVRITPVLHPELVAYAGRQFADIAEPAIRGSTNGITDKVIVFIADGDVEVVLVVGAETIDAVLFGCKE